MDGITGAGRVSSLVQQQFGANAERYVQSIVHAQGASLARMVALAAPQPTWLALDVAPGGGHSALALAPYVRQVVALDLTYDMLIAARRFGQRQGYENLTWVQGDGGRLPLPAAVFDLVTCRVALHHFSDQSAALRDWARVLKPGGVLVLVDNVGPDDPGALVYINRFERVRDPSHGWMYRLADLAGFVAAAGLTVQSIERLIKPMEFHAWMERMQVAAPDRLRLTDLLWQSDGAARAFLNPQEADSATTFSLHEGVILARKPGAIA